MEMQFKEWLLEEKRDLVSPDVLQQWERGFRQGLETLIRRTSDPDLRAKFEAMRDCPIIDARGHCRSFSDYLLSALLSHGVHRQAEIEDALAYAYESMMSTRKMTGEPKSTVFGGFDETRPRNPNDNPLEARFKTSVGNAVRNIASGRIRRLSKVEQRPQGTVSFAVGRTKELGSVSPEVAARTDGGLGEMLADLTTLLKRKQQLDPSLPLVDLFQAMLAGETTREQQARFGDRSARLGRQIVVKTIEDYARSTENHALLNLLRRLENPEPKPAAAPAKPKFTPDEQDYRSIVSVIARLNRPVSMSELGSVRRRWLEWPPRDSASPHRNRLADVLPRMVQDGVLVQRPTGKGGVSFVPGGNFEKYR